MNQEATKTVFTNEVQKILSKAEFHSGDVVRLKSGGPWMTIARVATNNKYVLVDWFNQDSINQLYELRTSIFKSKTLEKHE